MLETYFEIIGVILITLFTIAVIGVFIVLAREWCKTMFVESQQIKRIKHLETEVKFWQEKFEFLPVGLSDIDRIVDCKLVRDENYIPLHSLDEDGNGVFTLKLVMKKPDEDGGLKR